MIMHETDRTIVEKTTDRSVKKTYKDISTERFLEVIKRIDIVSPPLLSVVADSKEHSFSMLFVPYTLTEYIAKYPNNKKIIAQKIAIKLFELWRYDIVHGDIHSNNIVVDEIGEPYIIDLERSYNVKPNVPFCKNPDLIGPNRAFWNKGKEIDLNTILGVDSEFVVDCVSRYLIGQLENSGGAYHECASAGQIYGSYDLPHFKVDGRRNAKARLNQFNVCMENKTILDLGCNAGSICFETINRGAKSAHGIEQMFSRVATATQIKAFVGWGDRLEFSLFNFDHDDPSTIAPADIVCAFAIDHQTKDSGQLYKNLFSLTKETLLFESSRQPQFKDWCRSQLQDVGFSSVKYIGESSASDKNGRSRMLYIARK